MNTPAEPPVTLEPERRNAAPPWLLWGLAAVALLALALAACRGSA